MFNFTPLLGAQSASPASQSILEFDGGIKILIDVGWDESFDIQKLKELEKHVPTLSFILLTHATTAHLGAFAHCCKHIPLFSRIPVYATIPVKSLGQTLLQDLYSSTPLASTIIPTEVLGESGYTFAHKDGNDPNILLQRPTPEEIANYCRLISALKYSQPHQPLPSPFSPPLGGLTITAYSAGHTLGGTIWHIQHGMESVVYAVDWNQAREHVLAGAAWFGGPGTGGTEVLEQLRRPTALICSTKGSGQVPVAVQRNKRDEALLSMIRDTVRNGGSVLIPSDSSARILELAYLLEETWAREADTNGPLKDVTVHLASRTGGATMRYVRSMLEWMEKGIVKEFGNAGGAQEGADQKRGRGQQGGGGKTDDDKASRGPFDFRHVNLLDRKSRVLRMLDKPEPRVILASDASLGWGFSRDALQSLANDERNMIILTERAGEISSGKGGLGRYLWDLWKERSASAGQESSASVIVNGTGVQVPLQTTRTTPLEGNELALYQQYLARQHQLNNTMQTDTATALEASADGADAWSAFSSESSEDSDGEYQGKALNTTATLRRARRKLGLNDAELGPDILLQRKNVHDYDTRGKKGREKMFPYLAKRRRADEFGDRIRPEEYIRVEEEVQIRKPNLGGQKKKFDIDTAVTETKEQSSDSEPEEDDPDQVTGPSKVIITTESLQLNCRISFVDFSGLHDQRTILMLIPLIKPRKLILIAGDQNETTSLATECRKILNPNTSTDSTSNSSTNSVFTPLPGTTIDASVDTNAWTVKLSRDMVRKLQWQQVHGLSVASITGKLHAATLQPAPSVGDTTNPTTDGSAKKKLKLSGAVDLALSSAHSDRTPILDTVPATTATAVRTVAQPFHVGDLQLADLRRMMQTAGMTAEYRAEGTLVISGTVAVRKTATGRIEVDGGAYSLADPGNNASGTFFEVKRKIYEALAVMGSK